ncbi:putative cardiolipin synthase [Pelagirhabdus alkalitolerans]|uniref:Putative cardiolipin synthase n=1 Tax=Pelagirhabdus alkalitolerans TaxID=1612202 RepID=A0A1G6MRD1_9BACI|nr:phosphatidylserine/phosphatidylglycerophosphate/cardiolipin synthase family protein [Pelagirhabdus alkalitolerans]SDC58148.1 putative cardiolipin synthase [Pelagirhabdus alkalitolerans]
MFGLKLKSLTKRILLGYFFYVVITGVVMFWLLQPTEVKVGSTDDLSFRETDEKVASIDERDDAFKVRLDLIEAAEESLVMSYYAMQGGYTVDLFYDAILEAAERGVDVRFMIDGIFHNMRFQDRHIEHIFNEHPNIELAYYERFSFLKPWSWHNRLHDKFMIADEKKALIGGRNIGDKYFADDGVMTVSNDRDLLIINPNNREPVIIRDMLNYFDYVYESDYVEVQSNSRLASINDRRAKRYKDDLKERTQQLKNEYNDFFEESIHWSDAARPVKRAEFVHNSIDRFYKQPHVLRRLLLQAEKANDSLMVQTPYLIPTRPLKEKVEAMNIDQLNKAVLTNSLSATSNIMAHSGYRNHRKKLKNSDVTLYEYQGPDSSLHMKTWLFDQDVAAVGSFNGDARSTYLNTESMLIIESPELVADIHDYNHASYLSNSLTVDNRGKNEVREDESPLSKKVMTWLIRPIARGIAYLL